MAIEYWSPLIMVFANPFNIVWRAYKYMPILMWVNNGNRKIEGTEMDQQGNWAECDIMLLTSRIEGLKN